LYIFIYIIENNIEKTNEQIADEKIVDNTDEKIKNIMEIISTMDDKSFAGQISSCINEMTIDYKIDFAH